MRSPGWLRVLLALLAVGSAPVAADDGAVQSRPAPRHTRLELHVAPLTPELGVEIRGRLLDLRYPLYTCSACSSVRAEPGACPSCARKLVRETRPLLAGATVDVEHGTLAVDFARDHLVRWTELEAQLSGIALSVDPRQLCACDEPQLDVAFGHQKLIPAIEQALVETHQFAQAHGAWDADRGLVHVTVRAGARVPTQDEIQRCLSAIHVQLRDLVWQPDPTADPKAAPLVSPRAGPPPQR